jgi:Fe-S cluster assembly iron-binding protein IscA
MIEITDTAKSKIKEMLKKNPGKRLRLTVDGDGCAGPYLGLSLDEAYSYEKTIKVNDIDIIVSEDVNKLAGLTTINVFLNHYGNGPQ